MATMNTSILLTAISAQYTVIFLWQQWLHKRTTMSQCTYLAYLVTISWQQCLFWFSPCHSNYSNLSFPHILVPGLHPSHILAMTLIWNFPVSLQ